MSTLGLAETMRVLRSQGYTEDFHLRGKPADDFVIDKVYRFDVMADPDDQAVLYAIHSKKTGQKGILINGYGIYTDPETNRWLQDLHRWPNGTSRLE
jgi:hypothetical protein